MHDRVFFAVAAGVVPVTDGNRFSAGHMPALAPYRFAFNAGSTGREALLADPATALGHAEATYESLLPRFSLRESAWRIVTFCSLHAANTKV